MKNVYKNCTVKIDTSARFPKHEVEIVCKLSKSEWKDKPFLEGGDRTHNIKFIREGKK